MSSRRNTGAAANKSNGGSDKAGSGGLKSKKAGGKKGAGSDTQVTDTKSRGNVDGGIHSDNTNKAYNLVNSSDPSAAAAVSASSSSSSSKELNDDQFFRKLYVDERKLEKMESLEHENDTLKTIAKELRLRLDKHVQSQTQIIQHLKAKVKKRDKRITELLNVEKELLDKSVLMDKKYVEEKEEIEDSFKFRIEEYEGKIQVLEAQYREIKHFETNKSQLEHDLKTLEEQLDEEKLQHNLHVSALERRNVMEKNRLKNEMLRKIRETKLNLLAMTEDQLHTTTKRTIMENEQMTTELQYQSKETERIVRKNNKLMSETRAMKRQIELDEKAKGTCKEDLGAFISVHVCV